MPDHSSLLEDLLRARSDQEAVAAAEGLIHDPDACIAALLALRPNLGFDNPHLNPTWRTLSESIVATVLAQARLWANSDAVDAPDAKDDDKADDDHHLARTAEAYRAAEQEFQVRLWHARRAGWTWKQIAAAVGSTQKWVRAFRPDDTRHHHEDGDF